MKRDGKGNLANSRNLCITSLHGVVDGFEIFRIGGVNTDDFEFRAEMLVSIIKRNDGIHLAVTQSAPRPPEIDQDPFSFEGFP